MLWKGPSMTASTWSPTRNTAAKGAGVSASVAAILAAVFAIEGGWVHDRNDPGGETNHGITIAVARECGWKGSMKALPLQFAADCYVNKYIDKPGYRAFVEMDPHFGEEVIDSAVNVGHRRESLWIQEALNHFNNDGTIYPDIAEDGQIGPGTMAAYYALRQRRGPVVACRLMIAAVDAKQAQHYMRLSAAKPQQFEKYTVGWFKRVGNVPLSECDKLAR